MKSQNNVKQPWTHFIPTRIASFVMSSVPGEPAILLERKKRNRPEWQLQRCCILFKIWNDLRRICN